MPTANTALPPARMQGWDRAAIFALGAAGCALSYDALQQMAVAIHVRGILTYLFPLVIDGFIAYGVRALLVLRTAPFAARLYVWTLFGSATAASIWANALHAVRLNQQHHPVSGLRLGDTTVGTLSVLAPLALAGAVHLYILIARHPAGTPEQESQPSEQDIGPPDAPHVQQLRTAAAEAPTKAQQLPLTAAPPEPLVPVPGDIRRIGRPPGAEMDELMVLARRATAEEGKSSRRVVRDAVRSAGLTLGGERLTELMNRLREEEDEVLDSSAD
ncbi:DUF2637 domain-containing protein [Streptomyces sp. H39-C1]|uniref:DUF2637 domain-containing protein n=1 Tax=Streptomyces sp. H39-C1 TaxID=3004355 RepID=UPI0022B06D0B|nr:DUF2637 domain-containing protein [Streptomyces sp. H39-C1]MCZ4103048.1 DUF2637 domain-containing protein [Streptomyces sp. H39-C1]